MLKKVPGLRVVINHLGCPKLEDLNSFDYKDGLAILSTLPNVYLKISSLGAIDPSWQAEKEIIDSVCNTINLFSPERCMFGSNFPEERCLENGKWSVGRLVEVFGKIAGRFTKIE